ncbi:hypothetical protein [Streptomyces sp. GC420]|uniref:hypothetical protein n=1 Tax=Streptomyces sp. GC420 TaxID=2697568 RepID=UPI001414FC78|nr:hypothetical protein [Streptomyces sp. GC420]NBM19669.1 hypothetical protein [Streptomyces sp. GC420]
MAPRASATEPDEAAEEEDGPVFSTPTRDGGLGRPAARTWRRLRAADTGTSVEVLSEAVGYQASTVLKHLQGLARFGLAERRDTLWHATDKCQWTAAAEHSLPVRAGARTPPPG